MEPKHIRLIIIGAIAALAVGYIFVVVDIFGWTKKALAMYFVGMAMPIGQNVYYSIRWLQTRQKRP